MMSKIKQRWQNEWQLFLANYWQDRKPIYTPEDPQWQHRSLSFVFVWLFLFGLTLFFSPMPSDDLLRHVHAWQYDFDYRRMFDGYPYHFDAWFGFDWLVGHLYQSMGVFSIKLIQATSIGLLAFAIFLNLRKAHHDTRVLVVLIVVWSIGSRFLIARPTTFETLFMFIAIGMTFYPLKPKWDTLLHLFLGCLMASFYHLFFIYLLPLIIWRRIYIVPLILGLMGWQWLTGGQYFKEVVDIFNFGAMRIPGITVSENAFSLPLSLMFLGLVGLFVYQWQATEKKWALTAVWFSLPMQLRYLLDNLIPIVAILLARQWKIRPHPFLILFMLAMVKISLGHQLFSWHPKSSPPEVSYFEKHDHVMAQNLGVNFWVVNNGAAQQVKVAPAMEIGFADKRVQKATLENKVTCQFLHQFHFTKFVEKSAVGLPLPCLKLRTSTSEGYKIWQVLPEK